MKESTSKILIILFFIVAHLNGYAQSNDYYTENVRRIDAYANGPIKIYNCEGGMTFPSKYKSSKVKSDAFVVSFINSVIDSKITGNDIDVRLKKAGEKKAVVVKKSINGLIETREILLKGNYLRANIIVGFIDNVIVRSKVRLVTTTHGNCGSYGHLLDFKVIKDFFIKDVKMLFNVEYDEMTSDTIYSGSLTSLAEKRKDYKFNIPGSSTESWINEIFTKQYYSDSTGAYNYTKAPPYFIKLIKENKIVEVKDLLFSPNYVTSVNAMEALIYLSSVSKVQLTTELNDRITQIKNGSFIIMQQGAPDVFYTRKGYGELQTTDERVTKKYSSSM